MNKQRPLPHHPVNLDQLEHEIHDVRIPTPQLIARHDSAAQIIAQAIINLTWRDAEAMGEGIKGKMKDGESLTAAIQAWAAEWESFK